MGIGRHDGFVREVPSQSPEALEFLDGAAVETLGLGLIAEEQREAVGFASQDLETLGQGAGAVLGPGDFDIADEVVGEGIDQAAIAIEGLVEATGEESGFESGGAKQGLLGEGHALDGEKLLGIDGLVDGDEVLAEAGDGVDFFEADDGEVGGGEAVLAGVLGGDGLAAGRARSGGAGGVGAVGGEALGGDVAGFGWHGGAGMCPDPAIAWGRDGV